MACPALNSNNVLLVFLLVATHLLDISLCAIRNVQENELKEAINQESYMIVLFKSAGDCDECTKALEILDQVPQPDLIEKEVQKVSVADDVIAGKYGVTSHPAIVFFRSGSPALYDGQLGSSDDIPEFLAWLELAKEVATKELHEDSFEHLTQAATGATTGDWFVFFYDAGCDSCVKRLPAVESAAIRQKHRMNFAKVDVTANAKLGERFKITKQPTSYLFRQGKMYLYQPEKYEPQALIAFTDSWYRNVKAVPVPSEPTTFDALTDGIADYLRENLKDPGKRWIVIGPAVLLVILAVLVLSRYVKNPDASREKND